MSAKRKILEIADAAFQESGLARVGTGYYIPDDWGDFQGLAKLFGIALAEIRRIVAERLLQPYSDCEISDFTIKMKLRLPGGVSNLIGATHIEVWASRGVETPWLVRTTKWIKEP